MAGAAAIEVGALAKSFGETCALDGCELATEWGTVHAILGENGSGKSTLVKILSGVLAPDRGTVRIAGTPVRRFRPGALHKAGVATVFQEVLAAPSRSVLENLFLGHDAWRALRRADRLELARATLSRLTDERIEIESSVGRLPLQQRQLVTIGRALIAEPRILILDEATSALGAAARARLLETVVELASAGRSVIFISHRIDEIVEVADVITILRDGRNVACVGRKDINAPRLFFLMRASDERALARVSTSASAEVVLRTREVRLRPGCGSVDLALRRGEIVGLAGLEGHGQEELIEVLCGLRKPFGGEVICAGRAVQSLRMAARCGIAYLPRDRDREGMFAPLSVLDNFAMVVMRESQRLGFVRWRMLRRRYAELAKRLALAARSPKAPITTLSGGSQQKVLLARWLAIRPRVLLLNDPTRGVDPPTRQALHDLLRELATAHGTAVVLLSSDPDELVALADRVLVFLRGSVTGELAAASGLSAPQLIGAMFGEDRSG